MYSVWLLWQFLDFLYCKQNSIFDPEHQRVVQNMDQPLNNYWIASSHNTYDILLYVIRVLWHYWPQANFFTFVADLLKFMAAFRLSLENNSEGDLLIFG